MVVGDAVDEIDVEVKELVGVKVGVAELEVGELGNDAALVEVDTVEADTEDDE